MVKVMRPGTRLLRFLLPVGLWVGLLTSPNLSVLICTTGITFVRIRNVDVNDKILSIVPGP